MRASDGVMRCRCKVILSLVQGKTPTMIAHGGLCAKSQVYRVAERFIEHGLVGLADRREDNGENKATDAYGMELLRLIEGSPQEHGYRRPTWTQELLVLVLAERTGIRVSVTTMCRLLRRLGVRLNRPKPTVDCPWPRSRRTRRLRAIQRLVDNLARGPWEGDGTGRLSAVNSLILGAPRSRKLGNSFDSEPIKSKRTDDKGW